MLSETCGNWAISIGSGDNFYTAKTGFVELLVFSIIVTTGKQNQQQEQQPKFVSAVLSIKDVKDVCENHDF